MSIVEQERQIKLVDSDHRNVVGGLYQRVRTWVRAIEHSKRNKASNPFLQLINLPYTRRQQ